MQVYVSCSFARVRARTNSLGDRVPSLDEADENHDDRDDEKQVDESAKRVARHETEKPEHEKYHCDGIEHGISLVTGNPHTV